MASAASSGDCAATSSVGLTCPVCLASLINRKRKRTCELGKPKSCDHIFCFSCILEWSKNVNTCPVDRMQFNEIEVYKSLNSTPIRKVWIPNITLGSGNNEDFTYCEVCAECSRENTLLLCDGCDKGYHLDCLSPPLLEIPAGDWYCESCERIVQSQYDISMSSPDEEIDYANNIYPGLQILIDSDSCSSSDEHVDITGSDSDSSNIVVDSEPESDTGADVVASTASDSAANIVNRATTASPEKMDSQLEASDSDGSCEEIVKRKHSNVNVIEISSSDDSCVLVRRLGANNHKCVFAEDTDSGGGVDEDDDVSRTEDMIVSLRYTDGLGLPEDSASGKMLADDDLFLPCRELGSIAGYSNVPTTRGDWSEMTSCMTTPRGRSSSVRNGEPVSPTMDVSVKAYGTSDHVSNRNKNIRQPRARKSKRRKVVAPKRKRPNRKRDVGKRRKRRKKMKRGTGFRSDLNSWCKNGDGIGCGHRGPRTRARTAATHTPRPSAIRLAVQESYRHQNQVEGLERARTILANAVGSPHRMAKIFSTPISGYVDRKNHLKPSLRSNAPIEGDYSDDGFVAEGRNGVKPSLHDGGSGPVYRTYGFGSSSIDAFRPSHLVPAKPVSLFIRKSDSPGSPGPFDDSKHSCNGKLTSRQMDEIKRRQSTHGRSLSQVLISPLQLRVSREGRNHKDGPSCRNSSQDSPSSDLVGSLCRQLDDLNDNSHVIERDGTLVAKLIPSGRFHSCTDSQKQPEGSKYLHSLEDTAAPEASTDTKYPLSPSHVAQPPRKFSIDMLTKRVFPVLKGDAWTSQRQVDRTCQSMEKSCDSKSSGGKAGRGGGNYREFDTDGRDRSATNGDGGSGGYSSAALKHDPLMRYKIPKLNCTGTVINQRCVPHSLKHDAIAVASKAIHTFDCTEYDNLPNDPLVLSVPPHTKSEMKLQDMSNNCVILTPSLSPKRSQSVPSLSASSRCKSPTLMQKSLDKCTSDPKGLVKRALDVYFDEGTITNRQYKRILERATRKVEEGLVKTSYMNENRVRKLVSDYVEAYKYHGTWS